MRRDKLLLEEQERFMSSQGRIKPAARLIRSTAPPTIESTTNKKTQRDVISLNNTIPGTTTTNQTDKPPRAPSQFRSQRNTAAPLPSTTSKSSTSSKPDHFDSAGVISKVLEREYGSNALSPKTYVPPTFTQSTGTTGFPETFKTSKDKPSRFRRTTKKEKKQRSVFASMMADARKKAAEEEETKETKRAFSSGFNTPQEDALEIHQENTTRIAGMSMNEINDAKKDLMKTLSPDAIAILMKRRNQKKAQKKKNNNNNTQPQPTTLSSSIDNSIINVSELKNETDLLNVARDSRRTVLDRAKLDWTKDVAVPTSTANQMHTEIRFDLDGDVIAPNDDPQQLLGLHHHGRNPTSAGYAIDELLHLSRSTHDAQRTMALRTITKILQKRAQALISRTKDVVLPLALPSETHVVLLMSLQYVAYNPKSTTMREHAVSSLQAWLVPFNDDTARKKLETVWSSSKLGHVVMPPTLHAQHENLLQPSCRLDTDSHPNEELNWNFNANENNNNNNNNDKVNIEEELTKEEMDEKREEESKQGALRPVYWLLKRGLLKYIARILKICHLEKDSATFIKCLSILSFCARHSIMASSIIVNQSNVVLVLREVVFENYMDPICVPESLSFLRLLCSSNVDVVEKFCNDKLFIVIHKYILMKKNDDNDGGVGGGGEVVNECLKIIRICIEYGINVMESIRVLMEFDQIQSTKSTKSTTTTSTTSPSTTASIELTRMHLVETICRHVNMNEKAQR